MSRHISNKDLPFIKEGWIGNRMHKGHFVNRNLSRNHGVKNVLKWRPVPNAQFREKFFERWNPPIHKLTSLEGSSEDYLVWLGHNSFFLNVGGKKILLDPVFGNIPFVKRQSKLPSDPKLFTNIDYILISHDHFDHLDKKSIKMVSAQSPKVLIIAGLRSEDLFTKWDLGVRYITMAWYQQLVLGDVKITFMPALHWSKRSVNDAGRRLWGAYMIQYKCKKDGSERNMYYSGDTGYSEHFREVPRLFQKVDYALMGIGAYKPRWMMERNHMSPLEAVWGAIDMGAGVTIPMHYGTFNLSVEPLSDPPKVFDTEAKRHNIRHLIPNIGERVNLL